MFVQICWILALQWMAPFAFAMEPDCIYTGRGEVYSFDGRHFPEQSFDLHLERFRYGPGQYSFNETKKFSDGSESTLVFSLG